MLRSGVRVLLVLASILLPAAAQTSFCDQLRALTETPDVANAHWGIAVTSFDGTRLCGLNDAQLFRPASNNKLFTGAAALALLGADKRFETRVTAIGEIAGGVLHGSLELVGGGDANFGAQDIPYVAPALRPKQPTPEPATIADIEDLADKIVASGLRRIEGDVVGNDTYFAWEPYPPDWAADDLLWGYGAPVSALTLHDNEVVYSVSPGLKPGGKATVSARPEVPYYAVRASVYDRQGAAGGCDERVGYQRAPGSKLLKIFGGVQLQAPPCRQAIAVEDPAEFAAMALKQALERRGVTIAGAATARHAERQRAGPVIHAEPALALRTSQGMSEPYQADRQEIGCEAPPGGTEGPQDQRTQLAVHPSPPLSDDLTFTLKVSQNLHAEMLLRNLAAAFSCEPTQSAGVAVVKQYMLHAGLDPQDFKLFDGSGLSGHDLVTPRALARFLAFAATQPWFSIYKAALPIGGVDGSLGGRFADSPLKGKLFAKTGSLSETRALSGYLTAASGQTVIFSVLVDDHLPGTPADRAVMDRIVALIAAAN